MTPSTSTRSTFILLFSLLFPCIHGNSPRKCVNDCKCGSNSYWTSRQGIQKCELCTKMCSGAKNQVEVSPCTQEHNRVCYCKPGFYCEKDQHYGTYCHKPCVLCKTGTFSSKPSLDSACKPHKDCAQLGMIMLKEGNATKDRECAYATTNMPASSLPSSIITTISFNITNTPRTVNRRSLDKEDTETHDRESVNATTKMAASSTSSSIITISSNITNTPRAVNLRSLDKEDTETQDRESVNATTKMAASSTSSSIITISSNITNTLRTVNHRSLDKEDTETQDRESVNATTKMAASSTSSSIITISSNTTPAPRTDGTPQPSKQEDGQSHWLLLLLVLMLLFMTGFCMLMKGKALKTLSKCFGLINGKHEEQQHWRKIPGDHQIVSNSQTNTSTTHNMETEMPLGSDVRGVKGQSMGVTPQSGGVQQVTVEHNGKGENVSNTVGSIYIYSPGMVILGSNTGDKKEEAGVCEEARPLLGSPQQESNPPSQEVRIPMSAQEEAGGELSLSFPVPATGK